MTNIEKYQKTFLDTFSMSSSEELMGLKYQGISTWDSIGHMQLISAIEDEFGVMFETEDIIGFSSYEIGLDLLRKYNVEI